MLFVCSPEGRYIQDTWVLWETISVIRNMFTIDLPQFLDVFLGMTFGDARAIDEQLSQRICLFVPPVLLQTWQGVLFVAWPELLLIDISVRHMSQCKFRFILRPVLSVTRIHGRFCVLGGTSRNSKWKGRSAAKFQAFSL